MFKRLSWSLLRMRKDHKVLVTNLGYGEKVNNIIEINIRFNRITKYEYDLMSCSLTGKGLTMCAAVLGGEFPRRAGDAFMAKQNLRKCMDEEKVKGFADVLVTPDIAEGLSNL